MALEAIGVYSLIATKDESVYGTLVVCDQGFVYVSETMTSSKPIVFRNGMRGHRDMVATDSRFGPEQVAGTIVLEPTPEDLAIWLPRIFGLAASGTTYALSTGDIPFFSMCIDKIARRHYYAGCKVARATFAMSAGVVMSLSMDIVAQAETYDTSAFPSVTPSVTAPFIFSDAVLTMVGSARDVASYSLTIDNGLITDRIFNGVYIKSLPAASRVITLSCVVPYNTANTDLYDQALTGSAGTLALTNTAGAYSMTHTFGKLQASRETPHMAGPGENFLTLNYNVTRTGSTLPISTVLDSTP